MQTIKTLSDINTETPEGRFLLAAITKIWAKEANVTPDQIIADLTKVVQVTYEDRPMPTELEHAVFILSEALRTDREFRETWRANIAMAFVDTIKTAVLSKQKARKIANDAADRFLDLLCIKNEPRPATPAPGVYSEGQAIRCKAGKVTQQGDRLVMEIEAVEFITPDPAGIINQLSSSEKESFSKLTPGEITAKRWFYHPESNCYLISSWKELADSPTAHELDEIGLATTTDESEARRLHDQLIQRSAEPLPPTTCQAGDGGLCSDPRCPNKGERVNFTLNQYCPLTRTRYDGADL